MLQTIRKPGQPVESKPCNGKNKTKKNKTNRTKKLKVSNWPSHKHALTWHTFLVTWVVCVGVATDRMIITPTTPHNNSFRKRLSSVCIMLWRMTKTKTKQSKKQKQKGSRKSFSSVWRDMPMTTADDAVLRGKCVTRSLGHAQHTVNHSSERHVQQAATYGTQGAVRRWGLVLRYRVTVSYTHLTLPTMAVV